nr:PREDICTED: uncharacterized protein LOC108221518 [Daucus carota subsp. sativus]
MVLETTLCEDKSEEKRIETSATHSPVKNTTLSVKATELTIESNIHDKSPPTGKSSNKTRSRKTTETIDYDLEHAIPLGKRKSIKNEKYKNVRMHAFVPVFLMDKMQKMLHLGRMYCISNFQVKPLTAEDKWRSINIDRQILFTNQTKAKEIEEKDYFIAKNSFDFYDLADMKELSKQTTLLADVVGVVTKRDALRKINNRHGKEQLQVKMMISDGKSTLNVVLWDKMAEDFTRDIHKNKYEEPFILIIASGKVGMFREELDICNFSPTAYYINYNHHSVVQLRKIANDILKKSNNDSSIEKKSLRLMTVEDIKKVREDYIQQEVVCQVEIKHVEVCDAWYYLVCTSCYKQIDEEGGRLICKNCNNRFVPHPEKRFGICVLGKDNTGEINLLLMDRAIRSLFHKDVFELEEEYNGKFPSVFKKMEGGNYTVKLEVASFNIQDTDEMYIANDIHEGFDFQEPMEAEEYLQQPTEFSTGETSITTGSNIHLDNISTIGEGTS